MTILDLLAEAGGPTKTAHVEKIIIVNNSCCKNQAYTFNLMKFMRNPVAAQLPVLRPGDTIYVPDFAQSGWGIFMDTVKDVVNILTMVQLLKTLGVYSD